MDWRNPYVLIQAHSVPAKNFKGTDGLSRRRRADDDTDPEESDKDTEEDDETDQESNIDKNI